MTPERDARLTSVLDKRQDDITVVLENVFDPHNISAVMRSCDAVGIQEIFILNTRRGPHRKWGMKSSSSASKWLTIHQFTDINVCFETLRKRYDTILATHLSSEASSLYQLDLTGRIALAFGNEHEGLSAEALALCDGNFIIPQVGIIRSLNISVACAVSIYEAFRQKSAAGHFDHPKLGGEYLVQLKTQWGYLADAADAAKREATEGGTSREEEG